MIELIGFEGDAGVDVEVVARKWGLPRDLSRGGRSPRPRPRSARSGEDERRRARDFTGRTIVTIDGETARDFDDAIEAEELPGGGFRIGIHIADVSHYVAGRAAPSTPRRSSAARRSTSPTARSPMLPERLSNDLCSLRPDEERRTVSAVLTLDAKGETVKAEFFRSLIRSRGASHVHGSRGFLRRGRGEAARRPSARSVPKAAEPCFTF